MKKTFTVGEDVIEVDLNASYEELVDLYWKVDRKYWGFSNKNYMHYDSKAWAKFLDGFPNRRRNAP